MKNYSIFGINYAATNYEKATELIIEKAKKRESFGVSALAVHGLISAYKDPVLEKKINNINLVVPDGQPVKWALNRFYNLVV